MCVSRILHIESSMVFDMDVDIPDHIDLQQAVLFRFTPRPAGFRLTIDFAASVLDDWHKIFQFAKKLSHALNTDLFIDDSQDYGWLFSPNGDVKIVRFDVFDWNGEDFLDIIE